MNDKIKIGASQFDVLIAVTAKEHERGLMFQPWSPPIMAFPYNTAKIRKFWMKNTISPLDIIFCNKNKVIGIYAGIPLSVDTIGPDELSDLVVEFPSGMAKANNILIGDNIKLLYSLQTISKKFRDNYLIK